MRCTIICPDTIQETNSIDLFMDYALFSIYKASFTQNRITKNIVIKHLSHLLRSNLDLKIIGFVKGI